MMSKRSFHPAAAARSEAGQQLRLGLREGIRDGWAVGGNGTLVDLVAERTSGLGVYYVLLYIAIWGRYTDLAGEPPPSNLALSTAMKMPNKTLDRYRIRFAEAFPELEDPSELYAAVREKLEVSGVESVEVMSMKLAGCVL